MLTLATALSLLPQPENVERRVQNPALFFGLLAIAFGFPTLGFALLGSACWWRNGKLAVAGLAAFLPVVLVALYGLLRAKQ
ncbi:MAG: hypothetical protein DWQ37_03785 [Planctomycetota bacterium]|nr:MAG: hypothetical protein DWQ37_03785 [Planctomycetota bacterium]